MSEQQLAPTQGLIPLDLGEGLMDRRLAELGWRRHPLQLHTPKDGSCGFWGVAAHISDSKQIGAEDKGVELTKEYINSLRKKLVKWLPTALATGAIEWEGQQESPEQWMERMEKPNEWMDELMISVVAHYFCRDVVLVTIFPEAAHHGGIFCRYMGGSRTPGSRDCSSPAKGAPILLAWLDEGHFTSPHFQVAISHL